MKKFLTPLLAIFILTSCGTESMTDIQPDQKIDENTLLSKEVDENDIAARRGPAPKINVCHGWKVININGNAWSAHAGHGDVQLMDEDGDGWVTLPNQCGISVDCDDRDDQFTDNCCLIPSVTNPITGKTWMDRNLGASRVATSSSDVDSYGDLYQWGRGTDGHEKRTSETTTTLSSTDQPGHGDFIITDTGNWRGLQNDNLWEGVNGANNPCPCGYRLPTETELNAERLSWSSNNATGAFSSPLKWPAAGSRNSSNGWIGTEGTVGSYWSSTVSNSTSAVMVIFSNNASIFGGSRTAGFSVRCIKN